MDALRRAMTAVKARGLVGIGIIDQGGTRTPYLAGCLDRQGNFTSPTNFVTQPTIEAAVEDLAGRLDPKPTPSDNGGHGI